MLSHEEIHKHVMFANEVLESLKCALQYFISLTPLYGMLAVVADCTLAWRRVRNHQTAH